MQPQTPQSNRRPPAPQPFQRANAPSLASAQRQPAPSTLPAPQHPNDQLSPQRAAAADIVREQVSRIYDNASPHKTTEEAIRTQQQTAAQAEPTTHAAAHTDPSESVYDRTHSNQAAYTHANTDQVKQYHTAWQNYYQKYYERYYTQQLHASRSQLEARAQQAVAPRSQAQAVTQPQQPDRQEGLTKKQAVQELRSNLLNKVKENAEKARKSRHFLPIVSAVVIALVFVFLQYNRQITAQVQAYVSPGSIAPQNIVLDPTANVEVDDEPRLIIPKINVDAPVVYGVESIAENVVQDALDHGVVHYPIPGANSVPGQVGNTAILGHSSNDVFNAGDYKFIFVQLDQLNEGDTFYAHYEGTRYTYSVTGKEVIDPTEVNKLVLDTDKPMMTLITCTPPGTALKRLIIYAEQISPDPSSATSAPDQPGGDEDPAQIPDYYSPTIFERLFGG